MYSQHLFACLPSSIVVYLVERLQKRFSLSFSFESFDGFGIWLGSYGLSEFKIYYSKPSWFLKYLLRNMLLF